MKKTLIGALASLAMAGVAFGGGGSTNDKPHDQSTMMEDSTQNSVATSDTALGAEDDVGVDSELGTGRSRTIGSGSTMTGDKSGTSTAGQELSGKVVRADKSTVYIEHMGA